MLLLTTGDNLQIATLIEIYNGMAGKHTHIFMHIHICTQSYLFTHTITHTHLHSNDLIPFKQHDNFICPALHFCLSALLHFHFPPPLRCLLLLSSLNHGLNYNSDSGHTTPLALSLSALLPAALHALAHRMSLPPCDS